MRPWLQLERNMRQTIIGRAIHLLALVTAILLAGCSRKPATEITADPSAIARVAPEQLSLHGVRIGASESAVPESSIKSHLPGYLYCGTHGYKTFGGSIVSLILLDRDLLAKLNAQTAADLPTLFGPADNTLDLEGMATTQYTYRAKRIRIAWNRDKKRIDQLEIGEFMLPEQ